MDHTPHTNDTIFKSLGADHPQDFLAFFMPEAVFIRQLPTELVRDPLHADEVMLAYASATTEQEIGVHLEEQTTEDPTIPVRMLLYNRIIHQQIGRIVFSKVIYPFEVKTPTPSYEEFAPDGTRIISFRYEVIKLWEIPAETILQQGWFGLYPFVPLMQGGATSESLERASAGVQQIADQRARSNAMLYLFLLARRQMPADLIVTFWRSHPMYDEIVKESPFFEEILREEAARETPFFKELVRTSPLYQEIMHQGEERGIKVGELQTLREVALRLVRRHYPNLEEAARARLKAIEDTDQLQLIIDGLDDARDMAAAHAVLGLEA